MKRLINRRPSRGTAVLLGLLPFLLLVMVYLVASDARLAENPNDKLLPSFGTLGESIQRLVLEPSMRTGEVELWADTWASLRRRAQGVGAAALIGLSLGILLGALPLARAALAPFVASLSLIPPLALLPILFIVFGLDRSSSLTYDIVG
jgi:NitT/TauT family transport system permease protein